MRNNYKHIIAKASTVIGQTYPLYSFVTSNPLSGFESQHFKDALLQSANLYGTLSLPSGKMLQQAIDEGAIDLGLLQELLSKEGYTGGISTYLSRFNSENDESTNYPDKVINGLMYKWLSAFLDEGVADWPMPYREKGFYTAWRNLSKYDGRLKNAVKKDIPATAHEALDLVLGDFTEDEQTAILQYHIAALPGWAGYISYRQRNNEAWQQIYPITMEQYLAVRLWITAQMGGHLFAPANHFEAGDEIKIKYLGLQAWEKSWQRKFLNAFYPKKGTAKDKSKADAQLVFCIDTRSELIRKKIEQAGNYETFGYAGFFGVAMDHYDAENKVTYKSCPVIVPSGYIASDAVKKGKEAAATQLQFQKTQDKIYKYITTRMKSMLPSAFGYVEGTGLMYGAKLLSRTLGWTNKKQDEGITDQLYQLKLQPQAVENIDTVPVPEQVNILKSAFDLLGWTEFAPLIVFCGHASRSANNPFASSLHCGACAAQPGRHNARAIAAIGNNPEVRTMLYAAWDIKIPDETLFLGAEHNTATDEIALFDSDVPKSHLPLINELKTALKTSQQNAAAERLGYGDDSVKKARIKSSNWAETRPEWGLAKNSAFIIAPRSMTEHVDLEGQSFLHSYNWETDPKGEALEKIMQGPMVVGQWINSQYYFATVSNAHFGGGSKITQNIVGHFGVVQGNGGDLKYGLPLESVMSADEELYHHPLRLTVLIEASRGIVLDIINRNAGVKALLDNQWTFLYVVDPKEGGQLFKYASGDFINNHEEKACIAD